MNLKKSKVHGRVFGWERSRKGKCYNYTIISKKKTKFLKNNVSGSISNSQGLGKK